MLVCTSNSEQPAIRGKLEKLALIQKAEQKDTPVWTRKNILLEIGKHCRRENGPEIPISRLSFSRDFLYTQQLPENTGKNLFFIFYFFSFTISSHSTFILWIFVFFLCVFIVFYSRLCKQIKFEILMVIKNIVNESK